MSELWYEKYRPQHLSEILLSEEKIKRITQWFKDYEKKDIEKRALLFTGPPGLGKTSLAHIIYNEFGYTIREFNASDIRSKRLVQKNLHNLMHIRNIGESGKVGIIMDEIDGMSVGDKGGMDELISFISLPNSRRKTKKNSVNSTAWGPPMICICNTGNMKQNSINNIRNVCIEIPFIKPTSVQLEKIIARIAKAESFTMTKGAIDSVINYSQSDFRRLLCLLQHLYNRYGNKITLENVKNTYEIFCQKEQDLHINDNIKRILNKKINYHSALGIYQRDKSKAPMSVHQNYISAIKTQKVKFIDQIDNAVACIESITMSDIIEKTMYNIQGWYLQQIQGITCCYIPNYYMNNSKRSSTVGRPAWTKILGKNATTQYTKKNVNELVSKANRTYNYDISDIQHLSYMIIWCLMNPGMEEKGVRMLKTYNLDYSDIANLVKCSKEIAPGTSKGKPVSILDKMWKVADKKLIKNLCKEIEVYKSDLIESLEKNSTIKRPIKAPAPKKKIIIRPRKKIKLKKKLVKSK